MVGSDAKELQSDRVVVRYVGGQHFDPNTNGINGSAFDRNLKDVDGLSFTQRGLFSVEKQEDEAAIRAVVGSRMKLGKTACFVELVVGNALSQLSELEGDFSFVEDPLEADGTCLANPAHALLLGLPFKGEALGSLRSEYAGDLLRRAIIGKFPAVI